MARISVVCCLRSVSLAGRSTQRLNGAKPDSEDADEVHRELSANFDLGAFEHDAWFNEKESRIEMHLRSTKLQKVSIDSIKLDVEFAEGETILTEISRKFTPDHIETLLQKSGMKVTDHFQPTSNYFSLVMAQPESVLL